MEVPVTPEYPKVTMLGPNSRNSGDNNLQRVRRLRTDASVSEKLIWEFLRKDRTGFRFRRQHPIGPYVLDFYCPAALLCVEVDGEQHALRREADARRDEYLERLGILTIRIPSLGLYEKTGHSFSKWIEEITRLCQERTSPD